MFPYQWVLFDADETLFNFDAQAGLTHLFIQYNVEFTDADYQEYQAVNQALWLQYQAGEISAQQLQITRFQAWAKKLVVPAEQLNADFLDAMAEVCQPINGVIEMLDELSSKAKIGIVTNGFTALQKKRLANTGIDKFINLLVISEEVGFAKPERKIFEFALNKMANPKPQNVLMVGDNLDTDILGGNRMAFDTCWFNPHSKVNQTRLKPTFTLKHFSDFYKLVTSIKND